MRISLQLSAIPDLEESAAVNLNKLLGMMDLVKKREKPCTESNLYCCDRVCVVRALGITPFSCLSPAAYILVYLKQAQGQSVGALAGLYN